MAGRERYPSRHSQLLLSARWRQLNDRLALGRQPVDRNSGRAQEFEKKVQRGILQALLLALWLQCLQLLCLIFPALLALTLALVFFLMTFVLQLQKPLVIRCQNLELFFQLL